MGFEEILTELLSKSDISKAFNVDGSIFLAFFLGSLIAGVILLTYYYTINIKNSTQRNAWLNLTYLEKIALSTMFGFFAVLTGITFIGLMQFLVMPTDKTLFTQLNYISPFLYFVLFVILLGKSKSDEKFKRLEFIKFFIILSFFLILVMSFTMAIIAFIRAQLWIVAIITFLLLAAVSYVLYKAQE